MIFLRSKTEYGMAAEASQTEVQLLCLNAGGQWRMSNDMNEVNFFLKSKWWKETTKA